jgi:phage tail sheath gpL-like
MSEYPKTTINILSANTFASLDQRSILIVGQKTSGTAISGELKEIITEADLNNYFGRNSHIAIAGRSLLKTLAISSTHPKISAIALEDNAGGTVATGSFAITGTATASGSLSFYVDSIKNGEYEIDINIGDTSISIASKLKALIDANLNSPVSAGISTSLNSPVSAGISTSTITLTSVNKGLVANSIGLKLKSSVAGITVVITAMSGGATNPVLTGLFDNIVNSKIRFTSIAYPSEYTLSTLTALTEARINVDNEVLDGLGIIAKTDTYVNNNSFLDALNLKTLDVICNNKINTATHKGGAIFENNLTIASVIAGIRELRLTVGANISRIMSNGESLGGSYNGAIPYFNTIAYELPIIDAGNNYLEAERNELKNSGGSCPQNNSANSYIDINKQFTTYKLDNAGNVDKTYQSVNTLDTMSIVREYFFRNIKKDFAQHALTSGQVVANRKMVNKDSFIATLCEYYRELSGLANLNTDYALLVASNEALAYFKDFVSKTIVINLQEGSIVADSSAKIVSQLETIIINLIPNFEA